MARAPVTAVDGTNVARGSATREYKSPTPSPSGPGRRGGAPTINNTQADVARAAAAINRPNSRGLHVPGAGPKKAGGIPDHGQISPRRGGLPAN